MIKVRVVNVGLVRDASVDLRNLSVVMGTNNSGKSTIATVAYAAIKASAPFSNSAFAYRPRMGFGRDVDGIAAVSGKLVDDMKAMFDSGVRDIEIAKQKIAEVCPDLLEVYGRQLVAELERGLGATLDEIPTRSPEGRRLPCKISISTPTWAIHVRLAQKGVNVETILERPIELNANNIPLHILERLNDEELAFAPEYLSDHGVGEAARVLFDDFPPSVHYLPAARSGLLQSHRLVAAAMIQRSSMVGLQELSMPSLSGIVADFVSEVLVVGKRPGRLSREASAIEKTVLAGEVVQVDLGSGYPEIEFRDRYGKHPIHRTSSMISELAPVVLILRTAVSPGHVLILEEPESHLHPAAQVALAKAIYDVSRRGVRVILTTHSDFFLAALDNIVREARLRRRQRQPSIGAYWLEASGDGSRLVPLEVHPVDGISAESFNAVAADLYETRIGQQSVLLERQGGEY